MIDPAPAPRPIPRPTVPARWHRGEFGPRALAGVVAATVLASWCGRVWLRRPDPDLLWDEAERAVQSGRFDEARAALRRIERLRAKTAVDWILQAQLALADGRTDDALAALARVPDGDLMAAQAELVAGRLKRPPPRRRGRVAPSPLPGARHPVDRRSQGTDLPLRSPGAPP